MDYSVEVEYMAFCRHVRLSFLSLTWPACSQGRCLIRLVLVSTCAFSCLVSWDDHCVYYFCRALAVFNYKCILAGSTATDLWANGMGVWRPLIRRFFLCRLSPFLRRLCHAQLDLEKLEARMILGAWAFKAQAMPLNTFDAQLLPSVDVLASFTCRLTTCIGSCSHPFSRTFVVFAASFTLHRNQSLLHMPVEDMAPQPAYL